LISNQYLLDNLIVSSYLSLLNHSGNFVSLQSNFKSKIQVAYLVIDSSNFLTLITSSSPILKDNLLPVNAPARKARNCFNLDNGSPSFDFSIFSITLFQSYCLTSRDAATTH